MSDIVLKNIHKAYDGKPVLSGFSLTPELLDEMCKCPWVAGVKFTATDFFQLERMKKSHPELTVWNGFDEMLLSGLSAGADGGIGS
ncbi:MAG: dihydrodipicolinate synthase family protein, partial [Clostridia bacterium]|nr:dihydrodipicolinate synthase family protein [Clostridia bacterium]